MPRRTRMPLSMRSHATEAPYAEEIPNNSFDIPFLYVITL
jgi:hypothetical protein